MKDYVRDGVYNIDQAVDASWNEILLGNVSGKISEYEISNQIDFIKKQSFTNYSVAHRKKLLLNNFVQ